jgi:CheY-like chemotaxis protein
MQNKILIVDNDIKTSLKYKKWLEEEGFNSTLINYSDLAEVNVNLQNYDLVLIDFKMSIVDGFDLYEKLLETSKKGAEEETQSKDFRICFLTSSFINLNALTQLYSSEMAKEEEGCYVPKNVAKDIFIKHVYAVMSSSSPGLQ